MSFPNKYGPYVDTVGKDKKKIAEYIKHQLDEDRLGEQMTMLGKDYEPFKREEPRPKDPLAGGKQQLHVNPEDPFTGNK